MCGKLLLLFLVMSSLVYAHAQNTESDDRLDCENKCADEVILCLDLYITFALIDQRLMNADQTASNRWIDVRVRVRQNKQGC